jgi:hypothetical protein
MSPDLENFVEELRAVSHPHQATWDRYIGSLDHALREIDKTADFDGDTLEQLDEVRAIARRTKIAAEERLELMWPLLDALQRLADEKARITAEQLRKLEG